MLSDKSINEAEKKHIQLPGADIAHFDKTAYATIRGFVLEIENKQFKSKGTVMGDSSLHFRAFFRL